MGQGSSQPEPSHGEPRLKNLVSSHLLSPERGVANNSPSLMDRQHVPLKSAQRGDRAESDKVTLDQDGGDEEPKDQKSQSAAAGIKPVKSKARGFPASTSRKRSRNNVDDLSKNDFLSTLSGDGRSLKTQKRGESVEARQTPTLTAVKAITQDAADARSVVIPKSSRKRKLTYSNKTPNGGLQKKQRHVTAPEPEILSPLEPLDLGRHESGPRVAEGRAQLQPPIPLEQGRIQVAVPPNTPAMKSEHSCARASHRSLTEGVPIRLPALPREHDRPATGRREAIFQSTLPNRNEAPDEERLQAVAENYGKAIGKTERKRSDRSIAEVIRDQGQFTNEELKKAYDFRSTWCDEHSISEDAFDTLMHASTRSEAQAKQIWKELYEMYPYRKSHTLVKILRRHFHPYGRSIGWTKDEDQELRDAVKLLGKKWKDIASRVNRRPEDCRDRWRNYLQYDDRKAEVWHANEIIALGNAVGDLMCKVLVERRQKARRQGIRTFDPTEDEYGKLIDWHAVAQHVRRRSRLQCLQQWKYMEKKGIVSFRTEVKSAERRAKSNGQAIEYQKPELLIGDKLRLCKVIKESDAGATLQWDLVRSTDPKLQIFRKKHLRKAWKQLKSDHADDADQASTDIDVSLLASKIRKQLKKVAPKEQHKEFWADIGRQEEPAICSPGLQEYAATVARRLDRAQKEKLTEDEKEAHTTKFKSAEYVGDSDLEADA